MDNGGGYIKVPRSVFDGFLWKEKREFSKSEAFLDMLQSAHWDGERPGKYLHQGNVIIFSRGQLVASVRHLKERWSWKSNEKVTKFMDMLRNEGLIVTHNERGITLVTIVKYGLFESSPVNMVGTLPTTERESNAELLEIEHQSNAYSPTDTVGSFIPLNEESNTNRTANNEISNNIKEIINNNTNPITPADVLTDDAGSDEKKTYLLPEILKNDYLAVQKFILSSEQVKKLKNIAPEEYEKLREPFTQEQIMERLKAMENWADLSKKHKSVYLTLLNWLKSSYGKPELMQLYDKMEEKYREFVYRLTESSAIIDRHQREALHNLAEYFLKNSNQKTHDAAYKNWCYIISEEKWSKMDKFQQRRFKLTEIYGDILKIIKSQRDDSNNRSVTAKSREDSGQAKNFSTNL